MFSLCKLMWLKVQPLDWTKVIGASTGDLESPASRWPNTKHQSQIQNPLFQILIHALLSQIYISKTWNVRQVPMWFEAVVRFFKARGASQPAASNAFPAQGWGEWHLQVKRNLQTFASTLIPCRRQIPMNINSEKELLLWPLLLRRPGTSAFPTAASQVFASQVPQLTLWGTWLGVCKLATK